MWENAWEKGAKHWLSDTQVATKSNAPGAAPACASSANLKKCRLLLPLRSAMIIWATNTEVSFDFCKCIISFHINFNEFYEKDWGKHHFWVKIASSGVVSLRLKVEHPPKNQLLTPKGPKIHLRHKPTQKKCISIPTKKQLNDCHSGVE